MFRKGAGWVVRFVEETVPAVFLAAMVAIVVVDVIGRYVFNDPIQGSAELATALFLWVIFLGGAAAARRHLHVNIDVLVTRLPGPARSAASIAAHLALATTMVYLAPLAWTYATGSRRILLLLNLPYRVLYLVIPLSFVLIGLHSVIAAGRVAAAWRRGDHQPRPGDQDYGVSEDARPLFDGFDGFDAEAKAVRP